MRSSASPRILHVANGTCTTRLIEAAGIPGEASLWADPLYEGPVPAGVSDTELLAVRARHLTDSAAAAAATTSTPHTGSSFLDIANELRQWRAALERHESYHELILWFEHDLFDQLDLIQLLSWIRAHLPAEKVVSLVCIGSFPGRPYSAGQGTGSAPAEWTAGWAECTWTAVTLIGDGTPSVSRSSATPRPRLGKRDPGSGHGWVLVYDRNGARGVGSRARLAPASVWSRHMADRRHGSTPRNRAAAGSAGDRPAPRRGRPRKFGRPSQVVALTLPEEVVEALRTVHSDPGWAIVQLVEPILHDSRRRLSQRPHRAPAELVHLPGGRALIVVEPRLFKGLDDVSTIPLADGGAFLALDHGGLADLEVAIIDRLEATPNGTPEHDELSEVRDILRGWRRDPTLVFRTKSIIVAEGAVGVERRPLAKLDGAPRRASKDSTERSRPRQR